MAISLGKGQKINLSKEVAGLRRIRVGLGWDAAQSKKGLFGFKSVPNIDCDATAILLTGSRLDSKKDLVYYGNKSTDGVKHSGDNLTGEGEGDDETIIVTLPNIKNSIDSIEFIVNIYQAASRNQHFGMIENAYIHIVDDESGKELARYNLSENYDGFLTISAGVLERSGNEWEFKATGEGSKAQSISDYIRKYQ